MCHYKLVGTKPRSLHKLEDMISYILHCCRIVLLTIILFNKELLLLSAEADGSIK